MIFVIKGTLLKDWSLSRKLKTTQVSCKCHMYVSRISWLDCNNSMITWTCINSSITSLMTPRLVERVNVRRREVPYPVYSGLHYKTKKSNFAWVIRHSCSCSLCIRNIKSFISCSFYHGGYFAKTGMIMKPGRMLVICCVQAQSAARFQMASSENEPVPGIYMSDHTD